MDSISVDLLDFCWCGHWPYLCTALQDNVYSSVGYNYRIMERRYTLASGINIRVAGAIPIKCKVKNEFAADIITYPFRRAC